jgi:hypothetical protein
MKTEDILRYEKELGYSSIRYPARESRNFYIHRLRHLPGNSGKEFSPDWGRADPVDRPIGRGYNPLAGRIAQLVRALLLHRRGRRFESCSAHHIIPKSS